MSNCSLSDQCPSTTCRCCRLSDRTDNITRRECHSDLAPLCRGSSQSRDRRSSWHNGRSRRRDTRIIPARFMIGLFPILKPAPCRQRRPFSTVVRSPPRFTDFRTIAAHRRAPAGTAVGTHPISTCRCVQRRVRCTADRFRIGAPQQYRLQADMRCPAECIGKRCVTDCQEPPT
jgi:hypothetical protein